jgi:hypothetical protein
MPYLLSEWRARIQHVLGEYKAASFSVSRLIRQVAADTSTIADEASVREYLSRAHANEGCFKAI